MGNNVVSLPFEEIAEVDHELAKRSRRQAVEQFMGEVNEWCESQGIDISTDEYRHQAAVIMTQLQIILMKEKK